MPKQCPQCGGPLPSGVLEGLCPACLLKAGAAADTAVPPETPPFQPPGIEEVARLFPQLEILGFLGQGGMGAVYKARQPALDRVVALKILPPQTAGGPGFVERFNREARALAKLTHPNIVAVHEFGQVNGLPYFIMEFVDGLNLRQLERAGKLSPREALQIVPQICEALQFAHDEGVVHRDIKPENILVDKKGRVKIADFGIAKILGGEPQVAITETQGTIGTPHYMAPEQVEHPTTVDHRADIFSLGVVFYEMLTGELPLGKFAPPSSRKVEVDVRLDDVVLRALEKDPERRYQHASQMKTAVDTIASTAPPAPPPSGEALAREILARGYELRIGSCLSRGWALVWGDFWPIVGITALITVLSFVAHSTGAAFSSGNGKTTAEGSVLGLLIGGPLAGGLYMFFLKRIRGQATTVETAFSGFSNRFLHLFLGSFVSLVLIVLGFICCILPGIYLAVAWYFTLPLIIDKGLDFWSAMELSRKTVSRHWWKFLWFVILLFLLRIAGLLVFLVGFFIAMPIFKASMMYAYEDLFGGTMQPANPAPAMAGPSGTVVQPAVPPMPPRARSGVWKWLAPVLGVLACLLALAVIIMFIAVASHVVGQRRDRDTAARQAEVTASAPGQISRETLRGRLAAASVIYEAEPKDKSLAAVAADAAKAGEVDLVKDALQNMYETSRRNQAAHDSALLLAKRGLREQAIEIAQSINESSIRDQTLSELAQ
ncbi:MAG: protein kinase domain-containing protein [Limisphaerales bacterium]